MNTATATATMKVTSTKRVIVTFSYSWDIDGMMIRWAEDAPHSSSSYKDSEELAPGIVADYDEEDRIIGIEILGLREMMEKENGRYEYRLPKDNSEP